MADEMAGGGAPGGAKTSQSQSQRPKRPRRPAAPPTEVHERRKASIDNWRGSPSNAAGFACIVLERLEDYYDDGHLFCTCGTSIAVDCKWSDGRPMSARLSAPRYMLVTSLERVFLKLNKH